MSVSSLGSCLPAVDWEKIRCCAVHGGSPGGLGMHGLRVPAMGSSCTRPTGGTMVACVTSFLRVSLTALGSPFHTYSYVAPT